MMHCAPPPAAWRESLREALSVSPACCKEAQAMVPLHLFTVKEMTR
jgi:hypothetical protein